MAYTDGIRINGIHSYTNFGLAIASRKIDIPAKKSIRKTIPFMNGFYDFTKLNGGVSWGERSISYTFDIVGETVEEMDAKRTEVVNWLCNQHDIDIYDDTIPDYHFHGSFDSVSQNEDGEKSELTVTFICYPFMIENDMRETIITAQDVTMTLKNIGQPVYPIIETAEECVVTIGGKKQTVPVGEMKLALVLPSGETSVRITKKSTGQTKIKWRMEVL